MIGVALAFRRETRRYYEKRSIRQSTKAGLGTDWQILKLLLRGLGLIDLAQS